jgi:hypothetical protein
MFKNLIFYLSIIQYFNCETCDDFTVKNANIVYCELVDTDIFNVTADCLNGYQIQPNVFSGFLKSCNKKSGLVKFRVSIQILNTVNLFY